MKAEIEGVEVFKPVTTRLTLETRKELDALTALFSIGKVTAAMQVDAGNLPFEFSDVLQALGGNPQNSSIHKFI